MPFLVHTPGPVHPGASVWGRERRCNYSSLLGSKEFYVPCICAEFTWTCTSWTCQLFGSEEQISEAQGLPRRAAVSLPCRWCLFQINSSCGNVQLSFSAGYLSIQCMCSCANMTAELSGHQGMSAVMIWLDDGVKGMHLVESSWPKQWCCRLSVFNAFLTCSIFNLQWFYPDISQGKSGSTYVWI